VWHGSRGPHEGDYCIAEVPDEGPATLVEVLGAEDRPEWDDATVASMFRLRVAFPKRVQVAASAAKEPTAADFADRLDLRDRLAFTIDPADARDHDDALSVLALAGGRYEIGIHIADVSHYVQPDSSLDQEALERGTSCYLPGGVIPMLPERLSADLCSLRPDRDRLTLSAIVEMTARGEVERTTFAETVIRSRHRLSYEDAQAAMDGAGALPADVREALAALTAVARALRARRRRDGALDLDVPETKVWVDEDGMPTRIERRSHLESHELIEEFMLLANRLVGGEGARLRSGMLYRIHETPNARKLGELDALLKALGLPRLTTDQDPSRALQALLKMPLEAARRRLLHRLVLRTLPRARYADRDVGHFGLATRAYCHFTSPIRRYPDLHNHRRVREWIRGLRTEAWDPDALDRLAFACSGAEQNATDAERESVKVKGIRHLEGRLGERASGIITGLIPQGFFVELDDTPVEGFVKPSLSLDDVFVMDASGVRLVGRRTRRRFTLGDAVEITVARVDVAAREADFAVFAPQRRGRRHPRRG
jgi:ribonuclease R